MNICLCQIIDKNQVFYSWRQQDDLTNQVSAVFTDLEKALEWPKNNFWSPIPRDKISKEPDQIIVDFGISPSTNLEYSK